MAMFLSVPVNDDTLSRLNARLNARLTAAGHTDLTQVAAAALKAGAELPEGRVVHVSGEVLEALAVILQGGAILNQDDLYRKVERLAGVSFLHVRLPFTPGQLEDLQVRAERQGLTVEQLVERAAGRIYEQFFNMIRV